MTIQTITSAATSLNQVAAGFKKVGDELNDSIVVDFGGGKYNTAKRFVDNKYDCELFPYDPYNRSEYDNALAMLQFKYKRANFITCFNVLNVLESLELLLTTIAELSYLAEMTTEKVVYLSVYEGNRSGIGEATTKGFQRNETIASYMPKFKQYFSEVSSKKGLITCKF